MFRLGNKPATGYVGIYMKQLESEASMTETAIDPALTALDRCDRCDARAYLRVILPSGGELMFCAHHAAAHRDKLNQVAARIQDETSRLQA